MCKCMTSPPRRRPYRRPMGVQQVNEKTRDLTEWHSSLLETSFLNVGWFSLLKNRLGKFAFWTNQYIRKLETQPSLFLILWIYPTQASVSSLPPNTNTKSKKDFERATIPSLFNSQIHSILLILKLNIALSSGAKSRNSFLHKSDDFKTRALSSLSGFVISRVKWIEFTRVEEWERRDCG